MLRAPACADQFCDDRPVAATGARTAAHRSGLVPARCVTRGPLPKLHRRKSLPPGLRPASARDVRDERSADHSSRSSLARSRDRRHPENLELAKRNTDYAGAKNAPPGIKRLRPWHNAHYPVKADAAEPSNSTAPVPHSAIAVYRGNWRGSRIESHHRCGDFPEFTSRSPASSTRESQFLLCS